MYPDIFESAPFFRIQKFPRAHVSVFKSYLPVHTYPTRIGIHSSTQDSSGNIGEQSMRRKAPEVCILLYLVLYMIIDFIARIMAASARKSNKNARSKGETAVLTATTPLCFWFFRCRVDVLQN